MSYPLAGTGVWNGSLRYGDPGESAAAAAELESLGYSALWIPDIGGEVFAAVENLLAATSTATIATGILNLWMHTALETAQRYAALTAEHGRRFLVGIGVSHAPLIDNVKEAGTYARPLAQTRQFLDELDAATPRLPDTDRVLAALGPKMLELARTRSGGVHPYLITPEHTAIARQALGVGPLVAPEQAVALTTDRDEARALARTHFTNYLLLPNYTNNWLRLGFTEDDLLAGGSDRLVDALVAWGDEETIAARIQEHRDAGADHVCVQVLTAGDPFALDELRRLAPAIVTTD
jgi:probable F420-dependent oxidoreductase